LLQGLNSFCETLCGIVNLLQGTVRFGDVDDGLCDLEVDKCDVELRSQIRGKDLEGLLRVVKRGSECIYVAVMTRA
jgi:hypothetical protein